MEFNARRRKVHKQVTNVLNEFYSHDLNMYTESPTNEIPLSEFEDLALERLQLLRIIEQAGLKGHKMYTDDWKQCIKEDLLKNGLKKYVRLMEGVGGMTEADVQARRADHISHFILRMAYCRSEELRRWFITREMEWFRLRFQAQTSQSVLKFLQINNLTYTPISNEEKEALKNELITATYAMSDVQCEATNFYKVSFTEVTSLVKNRRVYLRKGYAYIPMSDLVVCLQAKFRAMLSESLNVYSHMLPSLDDDRLNMLLMNLHQTYTGRDYSVREDKDAIDPACLNEYAKKHFPMCMRHLHEVLISMHHLKHLGRLQYGLFLKGIGLLYEDSMNFWRQQFIQRPDIDADNFEKNYSYNIKHSYGKVGNRTNYSPYSCVKIITSNVGPGEHNGCPFKHWDASVLKQKMVEQGVPGDGIQEIMDLASNNHYQIACSKYFEHTHGVPPSNFINHPNQYFEESMNLAKDKQTKNK